MRKVSILLLAILFKCTVWGQDDSIDAFITKEMQKRNIPGLQLAIVSKGKIIKAGNYGYANLQDSIPVSDRSVFAINSITKAFVGVAIMQLVEEGKLSLTAPISSYLKGLPQAWQKVTVQQLLSHTSGIPDIVDEEEAVMIDNNPEAAWNKVVTMSMDFKPGDLFRYNQTNYVLLGRIIDQLSTMPFTVFITKQQLERVDMPLTVRAGFGATKEVIPHAAASYRYSKGKYQNLFFWIPPFLQSAAGMSSTAKEMANWVIALQHRQLLRQEASLTALWSPALLNNGKPSGFNSLLNGYGVGWPVIVRSLHPAAAAVGGGRSAVFVYPKDDLSIIVLTNLMGGNPDAFIDELASLFISNMKESNGFGLSPEGKFLHIDPEKDNKENYSKKVKTKSKVH